MLGRSWKLIFPLVIVLTSSILRWMIRLLVTLSVIRKVRSFFSVMIRPWSLNGIFILFLVKPTSIVHSLLLSSVTWAFETVGEISRLFLFTKHIHFSLCFVIDPP